MPASVCAWWPLKVQAWASASVPIEVRAPNGGSLAWHRPEGAAIFKAVKCQCLSLGSSSKVGNATLIASRRSWGSKQIPSPEHPLGTSPPLEDLKNKLHIGAAHLLKGRGFGHSVKVPKNEVHAALSQAMRNVHIRRLQDGSNAVNID